jgi:hypothetical protein
MHRTALHTLVAVALSAVVAVAPVAPVAPVAAEPAGTAAGTTSLTLLVHGCDGCLVQPVKAGDGSTAAVWRGPTKTVRHGLVHWSVAHRHTVGMSFDIVDPQAVPLDSVTNIVVAYRGLAVGAPVPAGAAAHERRANGCWAGTTRTSVTLRVRVEQFPGTSDLPPPVTGYRIRPYLTRTTRHLRVAGGAAYTSAFHGTIGNQDAYFCAQ